MRPWLRIPEPGGQAAAPAAAAMPGGPPRGGMAHAIAEGLRAVRKDTPLMTLMGISAVLNLAIYGPIIVGIAAGAEFRLRYTAAFRTFPSFLAPWLLGGRASVRALPRWPCPLA